MSDESPISWMFKLNDRLASPADRMADALERVSATLERVERHTTDADKKLDQLAGTTKNLEHINAFEFMAKGAELALHGVEFLVGKMAELGKEALKAATENEVLEKSFGLLLSPDLSPRVLDYLDELSGHLNMTDDQAKAMGRSLLNVGFAVSDMPTALAAIADMGAIMGSTEEALGALERVKLTGHLDSRSLRPLGLSESDVLAQVSANIGKPVAAVKKLMESGKLDPDQALKALYQSISKKTGKALGEGGLEMGQTLEARLLHLKNLPGQFFQDISHSKGFQAFSDVIGKVVDKLDPKGPIGQKIGAAITSLVDKGGELLSRVDIDKWADRVLSFLEKMPGYLDEASRYLELFTASWDYLRPVLGLVVDAFVLVGDFIGWLAAKLVIGVESLMNFGEAIGDAFVTIFATVGEWSIILWDKAKGVGASLLEGFKFGIIGGVGEALDAVGGMGDAVIDRMKGVLGIHSPSRVFAQLGMHTGEGFGLGLERSLADVTPTIEAIAPDSIPANGNARSGGAVTVSIGDINVTVQTGGGMSSGDAHELAEEIAEAVRKEVVGTLGSIGLAVGGAA